MPPDAWLSCCSPEDLSDWLLQHRFQGSEMDVTTFLLTAVSSLPNAQAISDQLVSGEEEQKEEEEPNTASKTAVRADSSETTKTAVVATLGMQLLRSSALDVSLLVPRVKAKASWHAHGIVFRDKNEQSFVLSTGSVERMIVFPKPEDCQPRMTLPPDVVLLLIKESASSSSIVYKNSRALKQVCLQFPVGLPEWNDTYNDETYDGYNDKDGLDHSDQWTRVFCRSLGLDMTATARVTNPCSDATTVLGRYVFESHQDKATATTTGGMPYVKCYCGVSDGVLYPMPEGLLFFKPPVFVHRSAMHSIAAGRGDGADISSRYVDLRVEVADGCCGTKQQMLEFTNIHRSELTVMNEYIHKTLIPAMKKDLHVEEDKLGNALPGGDAKEETKDDDDSLREVDPDDDEPLRTCRKRRAARAKADVALSKRMQVEEASGAEEDESDDDYSDGGDTVACDEEQSDDSEESCDDAETESEDDE
jgi:hypothetical protein